MIDEWQLAPKLWDAIRFEVDYRGEPGQFILTGSAVPASTKEITHSGTGRFSWLTMRPMSLYESGDSTGEVSLKDLFEGNHEFDGESSLNIERLAFLVCRGGWPQAIEMRDEMSISEETVASYVNALQKIFVIEDMPSWNPNLRSKTVIRSSNTRYFVDPSIAVAALGIGPDDLNNDLNTFGFPFETLCIRDAG